MLSGGSHESIMQRKEACDTHEKQRNPDREHCGEHRNCPGNQKFVVEAEFHVPLHDAQGPGTGFSVERRLLNASVIFSAFSVAFADNSSSLSVFREPSSFYHPSSNSDLASSNVLEIDLSPITE